MIRRRQFITLLGGMAGASMLALAAAPPVPAAEVTLERLCREAPPLRSPNWGQAVLGQVIALMALKYSDLRPGVGSSRGTSL